MNWKNKTISTVTLCSIMLLSSGYAASPQILPTQAQTKSATTSNSPLPKITKSLFNSDKRNILANQELLKITDTHKSTANLTKTLPDLANKSSVALTTPQQLASEETMALLWMRTAAEYRALCYQAYNTALSHIDTAIRNKKPNQRPLAIILDCDETVVSNNNALSQSAANHNGQFSAHWWHDYIGKGSSQALPGASQFLNDVHNKGVAIFYVTNRYAPDNTEATLKNLRHLGFPDVNKEQVLLMTTTGNKQPRFDAVAKNYDIILYMGDNYGDFPLPKATSINSRATVIDKIQTDWGTKYIIFPNPVYGSWVSAISQKYLTLTPQERDFVNKKLLTTNPFL